MKYIGVLAVIPVLAMLLGPILHNSATPFILGMPFILGWIVLCVIMVSVVMAIIYVLDPARVQVDETRRR